MRLAEAAGLHIDDLHLDEEIPYVYIKPHQWRSLKQRQPEKSATRRCIALWAAQRCRLHTLPLIGTLMTNNVETNSASNALNKWMQTNFREDIVIHGFRHALRDRLRAVQCPSEMIDQIGGWSSGKIGEGYGEDIQ